MTKIEWTEQTWNPVTGCSRVSAGCDNCYAVPLTYRIGAIRSGAQGLAEARAKYADLTVLNKRGDRHFNGQVRCHKDVLDKPLWWKTPRMIFVNSMSDLFHPGVPFEFVDRVFSVMVMCRLHTFQVLTKRPQRAREYLSRFSSPPPLPNVWLGTSVEDQVAADERIPYLLKCPAAVRFLSCEPLLGPIELFPTERFVPAMFRVGAERDPLHWVIVGGESGPQARACNIEWIRSIVEQCKAADVACFVKQLGRHPLGCKVRHPKGGDPDEWPEDLRVRQWPRGETT